VGIWALGEHYTTARAVHREGSRRGLRAPKASHRGPMSHANHPEADNSLARGLVGSDDDRGLRLVPSRASSGGPLVGVAGRDRYYATRLRQLARIDLDEGQAGELWADVVRHRADLSRRLGRDVG